MVTGVTDGDLVINVSNDNVVRVVRADPLVRISDEVVRQSLSGDYIPQVLCGEGLFVIYADNGTVRYRLRDRSIEGNYWTAVRLGSSHPGGEAPLPRRS